MKHNKTTIVTIILTAFLLFLFGATSANAVGPDFSALVSAVDTSTLLVALSSVAAIKMAPGAIKWGYNKLIGWFR